MAGASQSALAQPLADIEGTTVEFPVVFAQAPSTVIFFYRGRWRPWCRARLTALVTSGALSRRKGSNPRASASSLRKKPRNFSIA